MSRILIVEDEPGHIVRYYLVPLLRLMLAKPDLAPTVQIILLGHLRDSVLNEFRETLREYPFAQLLDRRQDHERDRKAFLAYLTTYLATADLAMIDRTVRGAEWGGEHHDLAVFNHAREAFPDKLAQIILVSSFVREPTLRFWEHRLSTLPKFPDAEEHYVALSSLLIERLADSWTSQLKSRPSAKDFIAYVNRAEGAIEDDLAISATLALKGLLVVEPGAPRKLSEAAPAIPRSFFDPATGSVSGYTRRFDDKRHLMAIRRRVLWGLQQAWREFSLKSFGDVACHTWIEVVAGGYHSLHLEKRAVAKILQGLRNGGLPVTEGERPDRDKTPLFEFDLTALDAHYQSRLGRQPHLVTTAAFERDSHEHIRIDSRGVCRFFEGDLEFKRNQRHRATSTDKFRVTFPNLVGLPASYGSDEEWRKFWKRVPALPLSTRIGHTEVAAKALTDELEFIDRDFAFAVRPTTAERIWWESIKPQIGLLIGDQIRRHFGQNPNQYWSAFHQSCERYHVTSLSPDEDADDELMDEPA